MTDCEDGFSPQWQSTSWYDWLHTDGGLYSNFTLDMDFELYTMQSSSVAAESKLKDIIALVTSVPMKRKEYKLSTNTFWDKAICDCSDAFGTSLFG
ncbi:hypothetical protein SO802_024491 [Lithocarpus litseifolius]|uniref:Uncharacterized protein n=1 Tax=Lithocarpus litseifolius TaxID=425828 RepID=A0AAW2CBD6_9ROSI